MTHEVFISYSSIDKTIADAVCAKLEEHKIRCWIAPRDIIAGQNFAKSIIEAIDASQVFVLIWSGNANTSQHILNEINQAFDQGLPIIPFRIQDVQPTSEMRYYFGRTHWLDALTPPLEKHIDTLAKNIRSIINLPPETVSESQEIVPEPVKEVVKPELPSIEKRDERQILEQHLQPKVEEAAIVTLPPETVPEAQEIIPEPVKEVGRPNQVVKEKHAEKRIPQVDLQTKVKGASKKGIPPKTKGINKKIFLPIGGGIAIVITLVIMQFFGVFTHLFATKPPNSPTTTTPILEAATITSTRAAATATATRATATPTIRPTRTPTPIPAWVNDFSEPILNAISSRTPDIQDDFSSNLLNWSLSVFNPGIDCSNSSAIISSGKMKLAANPDCYAMGILDKSLGDYVLQVEADFKQQAGGRLEIVVGNENAFALCGNGFWEVVECTKAYCYDDYTGSINIDITNPVTITFIAYQARRAVYVNGIPVIYFDQTGTDKNKIGIRLDLTSIDVSTYLEGEFDNLEIWDLGKIANLSSLVK